MDAADTTDAITGIGTMATDPTATRAINFNNTVIEAAIITDTMVTTTIIRQLTNAMGITTITSQAITITTTAITKPCEDSPKMG